MASTTSESVRKKLREEIRNVQFGFILLVAVGIYLYLRAVSIDPDWFNSQPALLALSLFFIAGANALGVVILNHRLARLREATPSRHP